MRYALPTLLLAFLLSTTTAQAQPTAQAEVSAENATVRLGPGANHNVIGTIPKGTVLRVIRQEGDWYEVAVAEFGLEAEAGFIHKSALNVTGSITPMSAGNAPTYQRPPTPYNASPQNYRTASFKDPGTSTLIGVIVPGGGHIYAGEMGKGLMLLGIAVAGPVVGAAVSASTVEFSCDGWSCSDDTNYVPYALGAVVAVGAWVYGIIDADDAAHRVNQRNGLAIAPVPMQNSKAGIGLAMQLKW